jgi:hypothetical protein
MPDPRVLQPNSREFYEKPTLMPDFYEFRLKPKEGWPERNTPEAMERALNLAHDNIRKLVRVNDVLRHDQGDLSKEVKTLRARLWSLAIALLVGIFLELLRR